MKKHGGMIAAVSLLCGMSGASAHEVEKRHGAVTDGVTGPSVEAGFTTTYQAASSRNTRSEALASFDLLTTLPLGSGTLSVYVEGGTTPRRDGVSSVLAEVNGDAGSALDGNGDGRLQVSGLHYAWPLSSGFLYAGLIDPTGLLDSSDVANDETRQFIGTSLVNNPSIDFPDYTLGVAWHVNGDAEQTGLVVFLGSSHGLSNNPDASYSELIDVGNGGKGVFAAAELYLPRRGINIRSGAWMNSADHERLGQPGSNAGNYGIYAGMDGRTGNGRWNLRLGFANKDVSKASRFAAAALEHASRHRVLGAGIAYTRVSDQIINAKSDDMTQAEIYARFALLGEFEITPSVQWLHNSGFGASDVKGGVRVVTLRLTWPMQDRSGDNVI